MKDIIEQMKQWCMDNYENGADTMIECWSDEDYADLFTFEGKAKTADEAWHMLKCLASIYKDQQADAENSAF